MLLDWLYSLINIVVYKIHERKSPPQNVAAQIVLYLPFMFPALSAINDAHTLVSTIRRKVTRTVTRSYRSNKSPDRGNAKMVPWKKIVWAALSVILGLGLIISSYVRLQEVHGRCLAKAGPAADCMHPRRYAAKGFFSAWECNFDLVQELQCSGRLQHYSPDRLAILPNALQFSGLHSIDLSMNQNVKQIPKELAQLANLTSLDLRGCSLMNLSPEIALMPQLTHFAIDSSSTAFTKLRWQGHANLGHVLEGHHQSIPEAILQLSKSVRHLDISDCGIKVLLPYLFSTFSVLESLTSRNNRISSFSALSLDTDGTLVDHHDHCKTNIYGGRTSAAAAAAAALARI